MAGGYSVTIRAEDQATAAISRINASLARMTAPVVRLNAATRALADRTGLTRLAVGFGQAAQGARLLGDRISSILPMFGALTGAATLAGMARLVTAWGEMGTEVAKASGRLAISAQRLAEWQSGARQAGISTQAMTQGLTSLRDTLVDAAGGRNQDAVQYFNLLGIRFRDAAGNARNFEEVLPELADKIAGIRDPSLQARVAMVFFGSAAGELLPILREGSRRFAEVSRTGRETNRVTDEQVRRAQALREAWLRLQERATQLANTVAGGLGPALTPLLNRLSAWVSSSDGLSGWVERMALRIDAWVERGGPKELGDQIANIATGVDNVVRAFGGWEVAIGALAVVITARLLAPLGQVALALTTIAGIRVPAWLLGMLGVGGAAAAGVAGGILLTPRAAGETPADRELLERFRRDPDAAQREMQGTGLHPAAPRGLLDGSIDWVRRQLGVRPSAPARTGPAGAPAPLDPEIERRVRAAAERHGVNPDYAAAIARIEGGGLNRVSPAGAIGPMQLMPGTARDLRVNPHDPDQNIDGGVRYLRQMLDRFGDPRVAAAAYNAGPNAASVRNFAATGNALHLPAETQTYLRRLDALGAAAPTVGGAGGGRVQVDVTLRGAPPGTTAEARTEGAATAGPPRIERAMPGLGAP